MSDVAPADRLRTLTSVLLDDGSSPGEYWSACNQLYDLLRDAAGFRRDQFDPADGARTDLPHGLAISPDEATHCLYDWRRTTAFAAGLVDAIGERLRAVAGPPVHVLYAGCGPFATLALPAVGRFRPDELQLTVLDVHRRSLDAFGHVVDAFDLAPYVRSIECADAAAYRIAPGVEVDVVVAECLLRGLTSEPQVAISWNLLGQRPDAVLVPERIELELAEVDASKRRAVAQLEINREGSQPLFTLDADAIARWGAMTPDRVSIRSGSVVVPTPRASGDVPAVLTTIRTHGERVITDHESGLTQPVIVDLPDGAGPGDVLDVEYRLDLPGVAFTRR